MLGRHPALRLQARSRVDRDVAAYKLSRAVLPTPDTRELLLSRSDELVHVMAAHENVVGSDDRS